MPVNNLIDLSYITITNSLTNTLIATYFNSNTDLSYSIIRTTDFVLDIGTKYDLLYTSNSANGRTETISRNLIVNPFIPEIIADKVTHCCYPKVEYKEIQHNYKLGSQNATVMKFAKFIINRNR